MPRTPKGYEYSITKADWSGSAPRDVAWIVHDPTVSAHVITYPVGRIQRVMATRVLAYTVAGTSLGMFARQGQAVDALIAHAQEAAT